METHMETDRMEIMYNKKPCYDIVYELSFDALARELSALEVEQKRLCIITDSTVERLYGKDLQAQLSGICKKVVLFSFPAGESSKTLDTVRKAYEFLIQEGFDRKDLLLALGGGVTGDLTGFVAATYLRGVDYVQIPTTLLAQADSSIGGKTGVDFDSYKNMVGAFKMPRLVYMNVSVLQTLEERQFYAGFAEIMKHGLIKDEAFYLWLLDNMYEICDRNPETLKEMVFRSCLVKKQVVEKDPEEKGERALLNFGHTIGHAVEKLKDFRLLHGECVSIGMAAAARISQKRGQISEEQVKDIVDVILAYRLPVLVDGLLMDEILDVTAKDKKMDAGKIKFVLLEKIGNAFIDTTVTREEMASAITKIIEN